MASAEQAARCSTRRARLEPGMGADRRAAGERRRAIWRCGTLRQGRRRRRQLGRVSVDANGCVGTHRLRLQTFDHGLVETWVMFARS